MLTAGRFTEGSGDTISVGDDPADGPLLADLKSGVVHAQEGDL